jgi:hypothetical protein
MFDTATFPAFHAGLAPAVQDRGAGVVADVGAGRALTLVVDGEAWTYATTAGVLTVEPGDHGTVAVAMDAAAFGDLLAERWSIFGLLYSGRVEVQRGSLEHFARWEPALAHLWFGRPRYDDAARASLVDASGAPLDVTRSFRLDDGDDAEAIHFLRTAGFAVLRGVYTAAEVELFRDEIARLRTTATPDDGRSWWATDASGAEVCCRLTYLSLQSEVFARLHDDPRLQRLASWHGAPLRPSPDRLDGYAVVIKNADVVQGLSDLPWHRDCGMGGHAVMCPTLNIGIQLARADAASGQLRFLAGSHHHTNQPFEVDRHPEWPVVPVVAEPGDVTVHYAHVLHVAPPPTAPDAARMTLYVGFNNPAIFDVVPAGKGYNDVVFHHGDGRVRSVAEL